MAKSRYEEPAECSSDVRRCRNCPICNDCILRASRPRVLFEMDE